MRSTVIAEFGSATCKAKGILNVCSVLKSCDSAVEMGVEKCGEADMVKGERLWDVSQEADS